MGENYDSQWELIVIMLCEIKITSDYISQNPFIFYVKFFFLIPIIRDYGI